MPSTWRRLVLVVRVGKCKWHRVGCGVDVSVMVRTTRITIVTTRLPDPKDAFCFCRIGKSL